MRLRIIGLCLVLGCVLGQAAPGLALTTVAGRDGAGSGGRWTLSSELLVVFQDGVPRAQARLAHEDHGGDLVHRVRGSGGVDVVEVAPGGSISRVLSAYLRDPRVAYAEPNLVRPLASHIPPFPSPLNDPLYTGLWGIENVGQGHPVADPPPPTAAGQAGADMRVRQAWDVEQGDTTPTVVAVIDSGVDVTHPDLAPNLWTNPGEVPADGIDNDGNGFVDDVHGWNFVANTADLSDASGHGTHVAGAIAASAHDANGVAGVCPHCQIMVLKAGGTLGLRLDALVGAMQYARAMGANVVNGSYGGGPWSRLERDTIRSLGEAGILAVFAAGNESLDNDLFLTDPRTGFFSPVFPASYDLPNILAVAASDHHDRYAQLTGCSQARPRWQCAFTNWGRESVDVAAPGTDILSTVPGGHETASGTSAAVPYAAGAAALVRSHRPDLSPEQIRDVLVRSADRPGTMSTLRSFLFRRERGRFTRSNGRINVLAALTASPGGPARVTDGTVRGARRLRSTAHGRVSYPGDVNDLYRKRLRRGGRYEAVLRVPRRADLELWVWKPGTIEVWQLESGCLVAGGGRCQILGQSARGPGVDEVVRFRARRNGAHLFHVHTTPADAGRYALSVRRV